MSLTMPKWFHKCLFPFQNKAAIYSIYWFLAANILLRIYRVEVYWWSHRHDEMGNRKRRASLYVYMWPLGSSACHLIYGLIIFILLPPTRFSCNLPCYDAASLALWARFIRQQELNAPHTLRPSSLISPIAKAAYAVVIIIEACVALISAWYAYQQVDAGQAYRKEDGDLFAFAVVIRCGPCF